MDEFVHNSSINIFFKENYGFVMSVNWIFGNVDGFYDGPIYILSVL